MRLLVLGGTRFVGRAVVEAALARGDDVTVVNRGILGSTPAQFVACDRTVPGALAEALGRAGGPGLPQREWDAVVDTWSGAPRVVRESARLLRDRAGHYGYVSSRSVYRWPFPLDADESAPLADGDPGAAEADDYPVAKRGAELAVLESFDGRALLARAGLILGPYENVGRLVWWLRRIERGGGVLAPGPADLPLQYLDVRDLADWLLAAAARGTVGAFNTVSAPGHTTIRQLLAAVLAAVQETVPGSGARLVWVTPEDVARAGIEPWTELPIWLPPEGEYAGMHRGDVSAAIAAGLTCRPVEETVADTWAWMQSEGEPEPPAGRPVPGLDPAREATALAQIAGERR